MLTKHLKKQGNFAPHLGSHEQQFACTPNGNGEFIYKYKTNGISVDLLSVSANI